MPRLRHSPSPDRPRCIRTRGLATRWCGLALLLLLGFAGPVNSALTARAATPTATAGSDGLYQPAHAYEVKVLPAQTITDDTRGGRQVGLLIRMPVGAPEPMPVIIFSHGGGPKPPGQFGNEEWGQALASAGYVVVHLNHTLNETDMKWACGQLAAGDPCDGQTALTILRPSDARAAIHALLNVDKLAPKLAGKIDLTRIAVAGHSFGSYTALTLAGATIVPGPNSDTLSFTDPTPVCFLALSPSGPGHFGFTEDSFGGIDRPMMIASGTGDLTAGEQPKDRHRAFELLPPGDKLLLWIDDKGSTHDTFDLKNPDQPEMMAWVQSAGIAWFDAMLRGDKNAQAWLASDGLTTASGGIASLTAK